MKTQIRATQVRSFRISEEEFLTTHELMKLLKIKHKQTIYKLIQQGMPAIIVGKNYRFIKEEVVTFLKEESKKHRIK